MSLETYYLLGRTGLRVSRLCLGTMTFGNEWGWGADEPSCRELFARYLDAGGNFVDTADIYTNGSSEKMLGRFVRERGVRDRVVLATKFTNNMEPGNPNAGGNGRKNILRAVDASLRRLDTDYIDLYILHTWDRLTPAEEVLRTLDDLVRAGKVRHVGLSDVPAWYAAEMQALAGARGYEPVSSLQLEYSLVERNIEREHVPLALGRDIGITVWSPLASGLLSGKYKSAQGDLRKLGRLGVIQGSPSANRDGEEREEGPMEKLTARNLAIAAELETVAAELGRSMAQVAINWVANRPAVASVILGATKLAQLDDNLKALDFSLPEELTQKLDRASRIKAQFPQTFFRDDIQLRFSGGKRVLGKPPAYWGR